MITSKTESLSASTVTSIDTWQRNAEWRRKNERPGHALNVTRTYHQRLQRKANDEEEKGPGRIR